MRALDLTVSFASATKDTLVPSLTNSTFGGIVIVYRDDLAHYQTGLRVRLRL